MSPYSFHYSKGKVFKKNFEVHNFPIEPIIKFFLILISPLSTQVATSSEF